VDLADAGAGELRGELGDDLGDLEIRERHPALPDPALSGRKTQ